jgi:hypothetical protein
MRLLNHLTTILFVMVLTGAAHAQQVSDSITISSQPTEKGFFLTGPHSHKNLSLYLIHSKSQSRKNKYLSLEEALEKGIVRVNETGEVNQLTAENLSSQYPVFVQSGDIVKGGKQDRTIGEDVVLAPQSGKVAMAAFCVESGRWQPRGREEVRQFKSSKKRLSSKELKVAVKKAKSQRAVWEAVEAEQQKLGRNLGKSVKSRVSDTSLQLTLEDESVQNESRAYVKAISTKGLANNDIVGYAYTINGKFNNADIYRSNHLFRKMWSKMLDAAACEAVASAQPSRRSAQAPSLAHICKDLNDGLNGKIEVIKDHKHNTLITRGAKEQYVFETRDKSGEIIHLNLIQK